MSRQITLALHDSVLGQHAPIFIEKCFPAVMLYLAFYVFDQTILFAEGSDHASVNPAPAP